MVASDQFSTDTAVFAYTLSIMLTLSASAAVEAFMCFLGHFWPLADPNFFASAQIPHWASKLWIPKVLGGQTFEKVVLTKLAQLQSASGENGSLRGGVLNYHRPANLTTGRPHGEPKDRSPVPLLYLPSLGGHPPCHCCGHFLHSVRLLCRGYAMDDVWHPISDLPRQPKPASVLPNGRRLGTRWRHLRPPTGMRLVRDSLVQGGGIIGHV